MLNQDRGPLKGMQILRGGGSRTNDPLIQSLILVENSSDSFEVNVSSTLIGGQWGTGLPYVVTPVPSTLESTHEKSIWIYFFREKGYKLKMAGQTQTGLHLSHLSKQMHIKERSSYIGSRILLYNFSKDLNPSIVNVKPYKDNLWK